MLLLAQVVGLDGVPICGKEGGAGLGKTGGWSNPYMPRGNEVQRASYGNQDALLTLFTGRGGSASKYPDKVSS